MSYTGCRNGEMVLVNGTGHPWVILVPPVPVPTPTHTQSMGLGCGLGFKYGLDGLDGLDGLLVGHG
jgi:hypothetical protein